MNTASLPPSSPATARLRLILGGLLIAVIAFSAGYVARGVSSPPAANPAVVGQGSSRVEVSVDDDPSLGAQDAPVTIIEFSDYQCPYCRVWHAQVFGELIATYGSKVRFVYRDFPLDQIHPEARPSAIAATCAGEQGKYWEYHNLLFTSDLGLSDDSRTTYAQRLGLDLERFASCVARGATNDEVDADQRDGLAVGVQGTPTFFINGRPLVGAQPLEAFASIIDDELK
jgi:protein-disulfide isomerase